MTSSDRVAEDGTLKPPTPKKPPEPDYLDMLHAEHHRGTFVPTLAACDTHTREQFEKDYGYLVTQQDHRRNVQLGWGELAPAPADHPQITFKSPPYVLELVDAFIQRRPLDFKGNPVPEDVKRRLEEAFGPAVYPVTDHSGPENPASIAPPTYKVRAALGNILNGHSAAAVKIVKGFSPDQCKQMLEALQELEAMMVARYSVEYIDDMLQVDGD